MTRCKREGLLTVASVDESGGVDLAWATIIFESETQRRPVRVFVGGLQGPSGSDRERVRTMTRACHGLRPKAAVMEAVTAVCRLVGADRLTAVSRALHVSTAAASGFRADMSEARNEARMRSASDEQIAVCLRESGKLIGDLLAAPEQDTFSIGWNFNPQFGGMGYAYEAAKAPGRPSL
ncbi:DUF535 family protein [Paraburkholderia heleia]|uniref:DUF535 family protein n=1 Tax=Paraburkholderia heleia TaxID=634127 RepID=UPI003CD09201